MSTLKERISNVIQPGESVTLTEVVSRLATSDIKLKADERRALEALEQGDVMVAKNRKHYLRVEDLKLSERYLSSENGTKMWYWRLLPRGRAWIVQWRAAQAAKAARP
jgi:hypothetical protein